ncbi:hypothetical protein ACFQGT_10005 [Natrialbaceae archaeon GCM10025810]|uniref:hypothetical protein n=1 Tax=Halovalidus salilacus TaxID=3075124 RepID=UPI003618EDFC
MTFGLLVGLELQYFLGEPLEDFTPGWFDSWLPFVAADRVLALVLAPVHAVLDVFYEGFAPDGVALGLTLCYYLLVSAVVAFLYGRVTNGP